MENLKGKSAYVKARKRVEAIRCFYYNLAAYIVLIPVLIYINITYTPDFYWFPFSIAGWGASLFLLSMTAFNYIPFFSSRWEEKKMRELIEEEEKKKQIIR